ncbi:MAG: hypothetical protein QOH23_777 [Gaiellaceae bacterium]|nr:hypothetical protein [Gaiellaceae bacterium]
MILAAYLVACAEIVGLFLFLSVFNAVTRAALVTSLAAVLASVAAIHLVVGGGGSPLLPRRPFGEAPRRGPLFVLAGAVGLGLAYLVALIAATPPNGWDPLNYHLARAAFWLQSGGLGYISNAYDQRLNFNPPDGEIGFAFVLGITRDENLVGFVQFFAALACAIGVYALARKFGLRRGEAAFGGLVFLSLPLVALQSSAAKNDLIVAAYLVGAAVFLLGESRREIALGSVATALAVGTKFTAAFGVAILLALVLVGEPRSRRAFRIAALACGALAGSYWYVVNAHETGHYLGDQSSVPGLTAPLHPPENLLTAVGTLVDTFDLSGSRGADIFLYALAALCLAVALTFARGREPKKTWLSLLVGLSVFPLLLLVLSKHVGRPALVHLYADLGQPKGYLAIGDPTATSPTTASDTGSWFGPAGVLLVAVSLTAAICLAKRKALPAVGVVAAIGPLAWFALVALTLTYNPWLGRFFVFPIALSAALWGLALRSRNTAWAVAALSVVTLALSLVHYAEKPSGLRLLDRSAPSSSVWTMKRWQVQSQHDPAIGPIFRYLDDDVPRTSSIALALSANDFGYPAFGPHLGRRVMLVAAESNARDAGADWLLASRERASEIDRSCWREAFQSEEATVFQHNSACPA